MEFLGIILALLGALVAYLIEKKWWTTLIKTKDPVQYQQLCRYLDQEGVPYRTATYTTVHGDSIQTVYQLRVLIREMRRVKAPYRNKTSKT